MESHPKSAETPEHKKRPCFFYVRKPGKHHPKATPMPSDMPMTAPHPHRHEDKELVDVDVDFRKLNPSHEFGNHPHDIEIINVDLNHLAPAHTPDDCIIEEEIVVDKKHESNDTDGVPEHEVLEEEIVLIGRKKHENTTDIAPKKHDVVEEEIIIHPKKHPNATDHTPKPHVVEEEIVIRKHHHNETEHIPPSLEVINPI